MSKKRTYFGEIAHAAKTVAKGMGLSGKHLRKGLKPNEPLGIADDGYFEQNSGPITIQYPAARVPVPDTGRYRLHMETEDCIGCDKCARICPVDCITIETFRADGDLGKTSDGTVKRLHLPVFDIDMGKCMYCGLCTTVCPTECLIMTKVYDFSEFDRDNLVYHFGAYSPQQEEQIREETLVSLAKKKAEKEAAKAKAGGGAVKRKPVRRKPVTGGESPAVEAKPEVEAKAESKTSEEVAASNEAEAKPAAKKRPVMRRKPVMKPKTEEKTEERSEENTSTEGAVQEEAPAKPKRRARPVMKRKPTEETPKEEAPKEELENIESDKGGEADA